MIHPLATLRRLAADLAFRISTRDDVDAILRRSAERLGVSSFGCETPLGFFQGSSRDRAVLGGLLAARTWAPEVQSILTEVFAVGGTLIDVGANIGLTSIPISKSRGVRCYAFEPDPENFRFLISNIAANSAAGVRAFNVAVMGAAGELTFERSVDNMGDHRVRIGAASGGAFAEDQRQVIRVEGNRLDALLAQEPLQRPVVLKVDTQGAEVHVLRGATGILSSVDAIILEYWPYGLRRLGTTAGELRQCIEAFPRGAILGTGPGVSKYDGSVRYQNTRGLMASLQQLAPDEGLEIDWVDVLMRRAG
jgi:FkbM family methyltransferase